MSYALIVKQALATLIGVISIAHAQAGIFDDSEARQAILDLRTRATTLESELSAAQRAQVDQAAKMDQLNQQIADLRGQSELSSQKQDQLQVDLKTNYVDLKSRLDKLESLISTASDPEDHATKQLDAASQTMPSPEETEAFNQALVKFRHGDFKGAELAFKQFIQAYPKALDQPNAQYWLGNALYAQRKYTESTECFLNVVKKNPTHPRAPEALLAVAQNQIEQKQNKLAKQTLQRLLEQYPKAESAKTAQKWIKRMGSVQPPKNKKSLAN